MLAASAYEDPTLPHPWLTPSQIGVIAKRMSTAAQRELLAAVQAEERKSAESPLDHPSATYALSQLHRLFVDYDVGVS